MSKKEPGVITVYLSLILMLLLALITSMLEHARLITAQSYCNRILQTAQESLLADYYLPLFEHYQVFGLHMTEQTYKQKTTALSETLLSSMQEGESPLDDDPFLKMLYPASGLLLCDPKVQETSCYNISRLTQNNDFKNQAISYEKYGFTEEMIDQVLGQSNSLNQVDQTAKLAEKKIETEQELAMIDEQVLSLIQEIEGLKVKNGTIQQTWILKSIRTCPSFVKQCITSEPTQENMGINHQTIFRALKPCYRNFVSEMDMIYEWANELNLNPSRLKDVKQRANINDGIRINGSEIDPISFDLRFFKYKLLEILNAVNHACDIVQTIEEKRESAKGKVDLYKQEVNKAAEVLGSELIAEFQMEYSQMDLYIEKENQSFGMIEDFAKMKESLLLDQQILENVINACPDEIPLDFVYHKEFYERIEYCKEQLNMYSYEGLTFDYSGIQLKRQENTILSKVQGFINELGANLVLPEEEKLSQARLTGVDLISEEVGTDSASEWTDFISRIKSFIDQPFSSYEIVENIVPGGDLYNRAAFYEYLRSHTTTYRSEKYQKGQVLMYEREYLLYGRLTDIENVQSAAMRLIEIRTGVNYIAALTNSSMKAKAEEFALMTAGFTQLPFLISFVKYLTLFIWAFEEALIETAALFMGKEVPIIKNGKKFLVEFEELLLISKERIQEKAKAYSSKKGVGQIGYEGYINIFLWIKSENVREVRMMDLIQENLRYEYEDDFRMKNCITGFTTEAESFLEQKFLFLPYFDQWEKTYDGYQIMSHQSITY